MTLLGAAVRGSLLFLVVASCGALAQSPPPAKAPASAPNAAARQKSELKPWLTPQQALARYAEAVRAEREGNERHAFVAYLEAAENGHGLAQRRMGDLFSRNGPVVRRDYETALRWYARARAQGVPIPKPPALTKGH